MIKQDLLNSIIEAIRYFFFFSYSPTIEEIHTFLKRKVSKEHLVSILEKMEKESLVKGHKSNPKPQISNPNKFSRPKVDSPLGENFKLQISNQPRYTLGEYSIGKENQISKIKYQNYKRRWLISNDKINKAKKYIEILGKFPQIKLIGLSGSVAMMNAEEDHDVDLFIIAAKNRLWLARFIAISLAQLMNLRRTRGVEKAQDKVCLNLFFDESGLKIPKFKQNEYVAHEILQMKPIISKDMVYEQFLQANSWVFKIFPNAKEVIANTSMSLRAKRSNLSVNSVKQFQIKQIASFPRVFGVTRNDSMIGNIIEFLLKIFQLLIIRRHQTTEIVTDKQLWFFPDDFEKKLTL